VSQLRVVSYNIRHGGRGREAALGRVINACAPDVVMLQEARDAGVVEQLARDTGMAQWATFRRQSLGFLSRAPVAHHEWHKPRISRHAFLEVVPAGEQMRIFGVHLSAVHAAWTERRRMLEVRALLASVQAHQHGLHVLTGDFNTLAPGELLDLTRLPMRLKPLVWMSGGRIRWRTIQAVLDAGYVDVYRQRHPTDTGVTFPTWDPHLRLDYVFVPAAHADHVSRCEVLRDDDAAQASDHFPILADIRL
jgi:endonuclease/exonuclease/phosphatase family metal-dependent hydrolase